jgi:transposase
MEHLAIDLGGQKSQICIRDESGTILREHKVPTGSLGAYLATRPNSRVIVETCAEAFAVADAALGCGHQVRVIPTTLVRSLGVGSRGVKTDQKDARVISEVSCRIDLPSVHIPSEPSRQRKTLCGMREALVGSRTQLINTVRGWLRTQNQRPKSGHAETFAKRVRDLYKPVGQLPPYAERLLWTIEHLCEQIRQADQELESLCKADPVCQLLQSVPGVGPVTAMRFVCTLDQVERFQSAAQVGSYLGLVPGEYSSSERQRRTGITKAGSPQLRWTLVQAAWNFLRSAPPNDAVRVWALEVMKRRGKQVAVVALAHKLSGILYALWRDGSRYQSQPVSTQK